MKTRSHLELLIGRKLNESENIIFKMFKNNPKYRFLKDNNGQLKAELIII